MVFPPHLLCAFARNYGGSQQAWQASRSKWRSYFRETCWLAHVILSLFSYFFRKAKMSRHSLTLGLPNQLPNALSVFSPLQLGAEYILIWLRVKRKSDDHAGRTGHKRGNGETVLMKMLYNAEFWVTVHSRAGLFHKICVSFWMLWKWNATFENELEQYRMRIVLNTELKCFVFFGRWGTHLLICFLIQVLQGRVLFWSHLVGTTPARSASPAPVTKSTCTGPSTTPPATKVSVYATQVRSAFGKVNLTFFFESKLISLWSSWQWVSGSHSFICSSSFYLFRREHLQRVAGNQFNLRIAASNSSSVPLTDRLLSFMTPAKPVMNNHCLNI